MPQHTRLITRSIVSLLILVLPFQLFAQKGKKARSKPTPPAAAQQETAQSTAAQVTSSAHIRWAGKPKITRYRLQLARDEKFSDIVFDKRIDGNDYTVTEIPPGSYFWRVAPAVNETGAYSKPLPVNITAQGANYATDVTTPPTPVLLKPPIEAGWRTGTGFIEQPLPAKLRTGSGTDFLGVNSYGMVYAMDGENGVALWSARYHPGAKKGEPTNSDGAPAFAPLLFEAQEHMNALVAFDSGVRALDGTTGRELWRAALPGDAMSGVTLSPENDGAATLAVFDNSRTLTFLRADSGQVISQTKLEGFIVGKPAALSIKNERAILMTLNNGAIDARSLSGASLQAIRLDTALTTGPLVVRAPRGQLVMIGTEKGLVALDAADLTPLWRVATESDAPQGILTSADLDNDGTEEVVMITRKGRPVVINVATGKIKWYAEGATDAARAAFADVNGDGATDVLVAGGKAFALGFSGRDGTLIWKADEAGNAPAGSDTSPRSLVAASIKGSAPLLIGTDAGRTGLRAVGLPAGSIK